MSWPSAEITWLIIGIVFLALEMAMPGFVVFFFGVGAWLTALFTFIVPVALNVQLVVFLATSIISLLSLRKFIQKTFLGARHDDGEIERILNAGGENAVVVQTIIPPGEGKISYSGAKWRALADEQIEAGTIVTIESQNGLVMKVRKNKA